MTSSFRGFAAILTAALTLIAVLVVVFGGPVSAQIETVEPAIAITGVTTDTLVDFPQTFTITANVTDSLGRAVIGLTEADFTITGDLAPFARVTRVESFAADNLPLSAALVLDISSSMAGTPFERLKEAALTFVDTLRPGDSIGLIVFSSTVSVQLPFTTDLDAARAAIQGLPLGGETALYQAAFDAVTFASGAPDPRRVIVLLSDGAEFGAQSSVSGDEAVLQALRAGIPIFTIGLGFGADRSFLQTTADVTNGRFYESPSADELVSIFRTLGLLFTNQYLITARADNLPLDGTLYALTLTTQVEGQTVSGSGLLRAPVPVPIVALGDIPDTISEPTTISVQVLADDPIASAGYVSSIPWEVPQPTGPTDAIDNLSRYDFPVDPRVTAPGSYPFSFTVTDADGDSTTVETTLSIPVLEPEIILDGLTDGETISGDRLINLSFVSQSPIVHVAWLINGVDLAHQVAPPYTAQIPALRLGSGDYVLRLQADNATDGSSVRDIPFIIAPSVDQTRTALAPTRTFTPTQTFTFTPTPTATLTPSPTFTPSPLPSNTLTPSATSTASLTPSLTPSSTLTASATATASQTPSLTPSNTLTSSPTLTPSNTLTITSTPSPTINVTDQLLETQTALRAETRVALATSNAAARALGTATAESRIRTQVAFGRTATASANQQATAAFAATQRQATAIVQQTAAAQQIILMQGTMSALSTTEAQATAAVATSEAIAQATITRIAADILTQTQAAAASETRIAQITGTAESAATAVAQAAISTQAADAQRIADATVTQIAADIRTRTEVAARTQVAAETAIAQGQQTATAAAATAQAEQSATAQAVLAATEDQATQGALDGAATATGEAFAALTLTSAVTPEVTAEATEQATAEVTAEVTAEPVDAQTAPMPSLDVPSDPSGLVIACALLVIALSIVYVVLRLLVTLVFRRRDNDDWS